MRTYRLDVFVNGDWITVNYGMSRAEVLEEAGAFTRFKIVEEPDKTTIWG